MYVSYALSFCRIILMDPSFDRGLIFTVRVILNGICIWELENVYLVNLFARPILFDGTLYENIKMGNENKEYTYF
uniref:Neur_chan_LBD domain-containing protein n=1 Tax=Heterorhabditis bacteriophora TaxID=37862 RepID=A0A1I7X1Y8_HETBA